MKYFKQDEIRYAVTKTTGSITDRHVRKLVSDYQLTPHKIDGRDVVYDINEVVKMLKDHYGLERTEARELMQEARENSEFAESRNKVIK